MSDKKYHFSGQKVSTSLDQPLHLTKWDTFWVLPQALLAKYGSQISILDEMLQDISGLDVDKLPSTVEQKSRGVSRQFIGTIIDTKREITIKFEANVDPKTGNIYPYTLFRDWAKLCYDAETGLQTLKSEYVGSLVVNVNDLKGRVLRKTEPKICFPTKSPDEWGLSRVSDNIYTFSITFKLENMKNSFAY